VRMGAGVPEYGLASHKGYSTPKTFGALQEYGPTPLHRQSFAPVWSNPVEQEVFEFRLTFFRPTFFRLTSLGSPAPRLPSGESNGPDWAIYNVRLRFSLLIEQHLGEG